MIMARKAKGKQKLCGAKKRQGEGRCTQVAGWGTDHLGRGTCKLHGGCTKQVAGPENPAFKYGRYSKIVSTLTKEEQAEALLMLEEFGLETIDPEEILGLFRLRKAGMAEGTVDLVRSQCLLTIVKVKQAYHQMTKGETLHVQIDQADLQQLLQEFADGVGEILAKYVPRNLIDAAQQDLARLAQGRR